MAKNSTHPDIQLFDYLNGTLDQQAAATIEAHLSDCDECASLAGVIRALKRVASDVDREALTKTQEQHPNIGELASFYYEPSQRVESVQIAAHVATCGSCVEAMAQYARADRAAVEYDAGKSIGGEVPAKAWEMISDWEDSSFGKLKPASEVLGKELLDRLTRHLNEKEVRELKRDDSQEQNAQRIPVLVVSRSGEVRSVEFFEKETDSTGASVLRHSEGSSRFDNKPVHALIDFGEKERLVVSNLVSRDTVRLEQSRAEGESRHEDYIIIED